MRSFRNWLGGGRPTARRAPVRPTARPAVEALEDRNLLNASVAFDAAGNMAQVVVFNTGVAFEYSSAIQGGGAVIGTGVRVAHVFRDAAGKIGLDIVYNTGAAFEFTSTGSRQIGNNNVLDVSTAFDAKGNFQTDVIYNAGTGGAGNLFEYTNTSAKLLSTIAIFASAYVDVNGQLGRALGVFDIGHGTDLSFTQDSTGTKTLYNGSSGGDPVTDYDQSSPAGLNNTQAVITAQTISTVTFGFGGCLQFGPGQTLQAIGEGNVASA